MHSSLDLHKYRIVRLHETLDDVCFSFLIYAPSEDDAIVMSWVCMKAGAEGVRVSSEEE